MRKILPLVFGLLLIGQLGAQETLFNNLDVTGAFGAVIIETGSINGEVGADVGGGGALIMSPVFIGGYGMGTSYPVHTITQGDDAGEYDLKFGHGGLWMGIVPKSDKLIHFYGSAKIGWGKARLRQDKDNIFTDRVFVLTPELGFEVNLTEWLKMTFTGGYRWVNGATRLQELDNDDFSSPLGTITFRMGGFSDDF
ncbi:MAG: hypothetical protein ACRBG0_21800 [Lewinella sp.]|jgi:hypothetical protein|uniref:hypothetical protein n=1 Tax=Lewinella TaxID=70994 RepID=UPI00039D29C5|nr:hypothetical protein [Lewinella cohaerens]